MFGREPIINKSVFIYAFSFQYPGEGKKVAVPGEIILGIFLGHVRCAHLNL